MLRVIMAAALVAVCGMTFADTTPRTEAPTVATIAPVQYEAELVRRLQLDPGKIEQTSMSCGIAPIPPIGCRVGACVCDQYGHSCQWTFVCR